MDYTVVCINGDRLRVYANSFHVSPNNDITFKAGDRVVGYVPGGTYNGVLVDMSTVMNWMAAEKKYEKKT